MNSPRKSALIFSTVWPPTFSPGARRVVSFAKYLEANYDVHVVTLRSQDSLYGDGNVEGDHGPVRVHAVGDPVPRSSLRRHDKKGGLVRKLVIAPVRFLGVDKNLASSFSMFARFLKIRKQVDPSLVIGSYPGPINIFVAYIAALISKARLWIDFRDAWTRDHQYKAKLFSPLSRLVEKLVVKRADVLTVVSHGVKRMLSGSEKKLDNATLLRNGADRIDIATHAELSEARVFGYFGSILGAHRDCTPLLQAVRMANTLSDIPVILEIFTNDDKTTLEALASEAGCPGEVRVHSAVSYSKFKEVASHWVAGTVLTSTDERAKGELTTKVFDYLGAGLPVLAVAPEGFEIHEVISEFDSCHSFSPERVDDLAHCMADFGSTRLAEDSVRKITRQALIGAALGDLV